MILTAGTSVSDKVQLVRQLGHGAMGDVWIGDHLTLKTQVAVKFVSDEMLAVQPDAFQRFSIEAAAAARIKSPHVVRTFDHGEMDDSRPYIVMELLDGETLQDRLESGGPLSIADTFQVIRQVGKALDATHEAGIIHRDIKPHNIFLLDEQGEMFIKLLDFGSAKIADGVKGSRLTTPGTLVGTPEYISRDLLKDAKKLTHHADLWALAVVAYKCLTGTVPFEGRHIGAICKAILAGKLRKPSRQREELSSAYDTWFATVFHDDPERRPQTGAAMAASFKKVARAALRSSPPSSTSKSSRGRIALIGGLAAVAIGVTVFGLRRCDDGDTAPGAARSATAASAAAALPGSAGSADARSHASTKPEPGAASSPMPRAPIQVPTVTLSATASASARHVDLDQAGERPAAGSVDRAPDNLIAALAKSRVIIPSSAFWMGCAGASDSNCSDDEKPGRIVTLDAFAMDRVEVSVALYYTCVRAAGCTTSKLTGEQRPGAPLVASDKCNWTQHTRRNHPINCIDHSQAAAFCHWVDARLPTEAEWEKAARGRDRRVYPWRGSEATCVLAVMGDGAEGCRAHGTWPTGSKRPGRSPFGILNMAGNVREWVADWYAPTAYANAPGSNPSGPDDGERRVVRGGGWTDSDVKRLRNSSRAGLEPSSRSAEVGFRCATSAP